MTDSRQSTLEFAGFLALTAGLGLVQFSIFGAEIFLDLACLIWLTIVVQERRWPEVPSFFLPLLCLAGWTLISCAFSIDPIVSFKRSRQLLWFLIVPGTVRLARGERAMTTLNVIIALGAIGALVGVFEATVLHYDDLNKRPEGSLGHYMTYAGIIMLVLGAAVARFVFYAKERLWPAIAIPALAVALGATFARNAWVGTVAAISVVLALRQIKLLLLVPVVVVLFFVAAPAHVKDRVYSIVDMHDPTSLDRRAMLESGVHMVRDHPLFGVGMNMVPTVYPQYKTADAFDPVGATGVQTRSHLHNVPMQLAAERGVPAALCWLWFVIVALRDLITQVRRGPAKALAAVGVTAVVGMVVAGMFEHNFGDSEFLILFLGLISLAFAARQGATTDARVAS
jgi:hypothetical protein